LKRGEITWEDKIIIIRDEVSKRPKVTVEGLWSGKDRAMISRMLQKEMRKSSNQIIQKHKQADLTEEKRTNAYNKMREAKKLKKEKEEEKKDVRGQRK